ncbi:MAG TPA: DASS family sodium-coupled anion symporter, partial [Rhodothermales bacterium]|nr:DASS family sodium-coupled anion symporter [Rhodothermales bacterium]
GLSTAGWHTAAVGLLMAVWWMTEALPIAATSLLPLVLFPLLGIATMADAATPYANPLIFLFLGGFLIALAMEKWGLHRRIALNILRAVGTRPGAVIAGFMISTGFISMWVSNTATALMMLPIALSVVTLMRSQSGSLEPSRDERNFGLVLMLTIAYSSSIGGMATLIGTPTNVFMAGFMQEAYGFRMSFVGWLMVGVPLVLVGLPLTYGVLRLVFPVRMKTLPGGDAFLRRELAGLGSISKPEVMVAVVFGLVAVLWITSPLMERMVPGISDTGIAMFGALLLFVLPVDAAKGMFVLDWQTAERLPWGVLLLFGGGLTLAAAIQGSGLATWIGTQLSGVGSWPMVTVVLLTAFVITFLTELTSNTATAAAFLPIVAAVAAGIGENPLLLVIPTTLSASCAFMLPVATPPNAIVYGSGYVSIGQMARAGIWLNVAFALLITLLTYTLVLLAFHVTPGVLPDWAAQ